MEAIPVVMIRDNLDGLPSFPLPAEYRIRMFREGEAGLWAGIVSAAGEFASQASALSHFVREFGPHVVEMERRCFFLKHHDGRITGTATAWRGRFDGGESRGRLHWVAIHPDFQGRGLCKPLVGAAMDRLAELHAKAYLTTQTPSWKAVKVYLDFGFAPHLDTPRSGDAWRMLATLTGHPALAQFREGSPSAIY